MTDDQLDDTLRGLIKPGKRARLVNVGFRDWLAFILVGAFISTLPLLFLVTIPTANKETVVYILGQMSGMALTVVGFYFVSKSGEDELNTKRAENTGKMADAVMAATVASNAKDDQA